MYELTSEYHNALRAIMKSHIVKSDRTGTGTISTDTIMMTFDLSDGRIPLVTTKYVNYKFVLGELLWFINGVDNSKLLNSSIWDAWSDDSGNLGAMYGHQLRNFGGTCNTEMNSNKILNTNPERNGIDQLANAIDLIKTNPDSRRNVITLWNPCDLNNQALSTCHGTVIQFFVNFHVINMTCYQRSADYALGVPYNIASYATLLRMIAKLTGKSAGKMKYITGDSHIYLDHIKGVKEQLRREPYASPKLEITGEHETIDDFKPHHFNISGYSHHEAINYHISI